MLIAGLDFEDPFGCVGDGILKFLPLANRLRLLQHPFNKLFQLGDAGPRGSSVRIALWAFVRLFLLRDFVFRCSVVLRRDQVRRQQRATPK